MGLRYWRAGDPALRLCRDLHISVDHETPFSQAIAEGLRVGDTQALAHVYRVLVVPLTAYLRSQVRDPHVVSDLVQETFVELIRGCRTLTGDPAQIRSWMFRAAQRNAIDHSRYVQRRPEWLLDEVPDWPATGRGPDGVAADNDEAEQMRIALARLRPDQAQVLTLRFVAGLSAPEVAVVMGKSQGAVRALQHRGVAALAEILRDDLVSDVARATPTGATASMGSRR